MKSILRNGEYLLVEKINLNDIEVPIRPHSDAIFQNGQWVLDADILVSKTASKEALAFLSSTDWKVIRHRDQLALNIETSLSEEEYILLLEKRQQARREVINDITD